MKRPMPYQSSLGSRDRMVLSRGFRFIKKKARPALIAVNGSSIQPSHRQVTYSVQKAPTIGPRITPTAMGVAAIPIHSGRSFKVVMSHISTAFSTSSPPPPSPAIRRPAITTPIFGARANTSGSAPRRKKAAQSSGFRSIMFEALK